MSFILSFLATTLGRWVAIGIGASVLVGGFAYSNQRKGAAKELAKITRAADANAKKADAARGAVSRLPADGLRDSYGRD